MQRARFYLESRNLNETILLPDLRIDHERMAKRLKLLGLNAIFTSITDISAREIMELYGRRNRVEHCFRTINTMDMAFPVYHWMAQKIRVHMFMSLLAYLFLALMRMRIRPVMELYLPAVIEVLSSIRIVYIARGKNVSTALTTPDERAKTIMEAMNLRQIL
jgi:transposase